MPREPLFLTEVPRTDMGSHGKEAIKQVSAFFVRDQVVSISGFVDHVFSIATTNCCSNENSAIENMLVSRCGCVLIKLYLEKSGFPHWIWPQCFSSGPN